MPKFKVVKMNAYRVTRNENESKLVKSSLGFSEFNKLIFEGYMIEQLDNDNKVIKIGFGMNLNLCDTFKKVKPTNLFKLLQAIKAAKAANQHINTFAARQAK